MRATVKVAPASRRTAAPARVSRLHEPSRLASVSALHGTIGNCRVARLLNADVARAQLTPEGDVLRRQPEETPKKEEPKKEEPKKEAPKTTGWSRKLDSGPRGLDGRHASYGLTFNHILPQVPSGAKQVWQVVENQKETLGDSCEVETEQEFIVDIVNIKGRTKVLDQWIWDPAGDPCFAKEASMAQVGFDDGVSGFREQANKNVSEADAKDLMQKMVAPIGTYTGTYTFVKKGACKPCDKELADLRKDRSVPVGERLSIDGVGDFKSRK